MERETDLSHRGCAADGYAMCPACGHHTSAYCGSCTAFVMEEDGSVHYCGCDCVVAMGGKFLSETLAEVMHGPRVE